MMVDFWTRAAECRHDNLYDSFNGESGGCSTPYCCGWSESHCEDCEAYVTDCPCGACFDMSGWSNKRRKAFDRRAR